MYNFHHHISFKDISEIFYYWAAGIGLLFGGVGGLKLFRDMQKERKQMDKFKNFQKMYPPSNINKTFDLFKEESGNKVYVHDRETHELHWIKNQHTRIELGFNTGDYVNKTNEEINKYKPGEPIIAP